MNVYRVHYKDKSGKSLGFDYFPGELVANAAVKTAERRGRQAESKCYDVPLTRKGVLNALTQFGSHPDNS